MQCIEPAFVRSMMRRNVALAICLVGLFISSLNASSQSYPSKSIRVIVPAAPGGGTDHITRLLGQKYQEQFGQTWIVENRAGANGIIGTEAISKAAPDGYSLVMVYVSHAVNQTMYKKVPYDALRDFQPVTQVSTQPLVMVVHPSLPVGNVKQLVALAKARPGEVNYGSSGSGTGPHLAMELLRTLSNVKINHIPYKGGGPLMTSLISGEVSLAYSTPPPAIPQIKAGRIKAIAVSGEKRMVQLPDVPTVAESGFPGYEASTWYGLVAPAGTPSAIVIQLSEQVAKILSQKEVQESFVKQGVIPVGSKPQEFSDYIRSEISKWGNVVKVSGAQVD